MTNENQNFKNTRNQYRSGRCHRCRCRWQRKHHRKNITVVNNQTRGYCLTLIHPNYFKENSDTDPNFKDWKDGFAVSLESICCKTEYRREGILEQGCYIWENLALHKLLSCLRLFVITLRRIIRFFILKEMKNQRNLIRLLNS
jgi:hypothetical protein